MICNKCGAKINSDALFCPECGSAVTRQKKQRPEAQGERNNYSQEKSIHRSRYGNERDEYYVSNHSSGGSKTPIIILCILAGIIVLLLTVIASYKLMGDHLGVSATPIPSATALPSPEPTSAPSPTPQVIYVTPPPQQHSYQYNPPAPPPHNPPSAGGYRTYYSSKYGFSCKYPADFITYDDGTMSLYTVHSPVDGGYQKINAAPINGNTVSSSKNDYISNHSGTITYQSSGSDYYAVNIRSGGTEYYKYCKFRNGNMYWFEFTYPVSQHDLYDIYINDVYNSISYDY